MQWIAASEKKTVTDTFEKRLHDADPLRANSGLK